MNKRNVQIFGWKAYRPEKSHVLGIAILILVVIGAFWFITDSGLQGTSSVTTSAVIPLPVEQTQQQPSSIESKTQQIPQEQIPSEPPATEEEKPFIAYGGKCAADVKQAQDDVGQINNYMNKYKQDYDATKAELDAKIAEIQKQYSNFFENSDVKMKQAEQDLQAAQSNLNKVKEACTP